MAGKYGFIIPKTARQDSMVAKPDLAAGYTSDGCTSEPT
jgi:hypothetical protein